MQEPRNVPPQPGAPASPQVITDFMIYFRNLSRNDILIPSRAARGAAGGWRGSLLSSPAISPECWLSWMWSFPSGPPEPGCGMEDCL